MYTPSESLPPDPLLGTILESSGGIYRVFLDSTASQSSQPSSEGSPVVEASLRGRLKKDSRGGGRIVAGDRVRLEPTTDGGWTVEEVEPRSSELVRAGPGGRHPKVIAANVDRLLVVASLTRPSLRLDLVDRYLVLAESCELDAILLLTKTDLLETSGAPEREEVEEVAALYREVGYPVVLTSLRSGEGLEEVERLLRAGTAALVGPSGAGKSSLLNAVIPGLSLRVGDVSRRGGRGRHTTVGARLIPLPGGGQVVDTPGFSEVSLWDFDSRQLPWAFPEFRELAGECRFRGCIHLEEPECAVQEALKEGEIPESRFRSYQALQEAARA